MEKLRMEDRTRQRTSAACDACRIRKVKCIVPDDQSHNIKCSVCSELKIECTSVRPRKKRGPKNRYVQALRAQLDGEVADRDEEQHDLDLIAPPDVLQRIVDDWFDLIHPVAPILHRDQFMHRISGNGHRERERSASFVLLVASVSAATVASLRRRREIYGTVTVEKCLEVAERLKLWSMASKTTLDRALMMYNFSSAVHHEYGIDSSLGHRLYGEASTSVAYLLHQHLGQMSFMEQQILKRLYWLIYAGQCTMEMHGRRMLILRHAHEPVSSLLPMATVTDELLSCGPVSTPHDDTSPDYSYITGLNALSRLFLVWQSSQATTIQTMENLQQHVSRAHEALANLPPELVAFEQPGQAGHFGFSVQKVNLKVTQLHIRANLLEQMNGLAKDQGIAITPDAIIDERHLVVEELLDLLYTMPEEVFDANGYSIVPKIRDIGSALFDELRTGSHGRTLQASINLDKLLAKLESLDSPLSLRLIQ